MPFGISSSIKQACLFFLEYFMDKSALVKRMWLTKRARTNAESRLIFFDQCTNFFIPYYSVMLSAFVIAPKYVALDDAVKSNAEWILVVLSFLILVLSILVSNQDLKLRAYKMKVCYIEIGKIENDLESGKDMYAANDRYLELLGNHENHWTYDFHAINPWSRLSSTESLIPFLIRNLKYKSYQVAGYLFIVVLFMFPLYIFFKYFIGKT
jgi:hypothetical protein